FGLDFYNFLAGEYLNYILYSNIAFKVNYYESRTKITFIPNHWQNTKEQREGLIQIKEVIAEEKQGQITNPLTNRPALYGTLLNGNKTNFFTRKGLLT